MIEESKCALGRGGTGAFVPDCLGCWVFGRTPESALKKARVAVVEWLGWLRRHGERPRIKADEIEVVEGEILRVTYNPVEAGKPEPLFWSEVLPISGKEIEGTIRLMGCSRSDLLKLVSALDGEVLDWQPPERPRAIRNCLRHIGIVEWWHITCLEIDLPEEFPEDVFELLRSTRETALYKLQNLPEEKWSGVFQPKKHVDPEAVKRFKVDGIHLDDLGRRFQTDDFDPAHTLAKLIADIRAGVQSVNPNAIVEGNTWEILVEPADVIYQEEDAVWVEITSLPEYPGPHPTYRGVDQLLRKEGRKQGCNSWKALVGAIELSTCNCLGPLNSTHII